MSPALGGGGGAGVVRRAEAAGVADLYSHNVKVEWLRLSLAAVGVGGGAPAGLDAPDAPVGDLAATGSWAAVVEAANAADLNASYLHRLLPAGGGGGGGGGGRGGGGGSRGALLGRALILLQVIDALALRGSRWPTPVLRAGSPASMAAALLVGLLPLFADPLRLIPTHLLPASVDSAFTATRAVRTALAAGEVPLTAVGTPLDGLPAWPCAAWSWGVTGTRVWGAAGKDGRRAWCGGAWREGSPARGPRAEPRRAARNWACTWRVAAGGLVAVGVPLSGVAAGGGAGRGRAAAAAGGEGELVRGGIGAAWAVTVASTCRGVTATAMWAEVRALRRAARAAAATEGGVAWGHLEEAPAWATAADGSSAAAGADASALSLCTDGSGSGRRGSGFGGGSPYGWPDEDEQEYDNEDAGGAAGGDADAAAPAGRARVRCR
ncbi:hypothetical protein I4F81_002902 [Pyropia yezoensis]|uniref:Uncharacterized protein n=1 Tax=Pyropia yezoensis TaxID=2788 RepID=A0ACC3BRU3_PYRYE|nr:hypothetical protein I4F81_002902 [Neopyropia yezoensis]